MAWRGLGGATQARMPGRSVFGLRQLEVGDGRAGGLKPLVQQARSLHGHQHILVALDEQGGRYIWPHVGLHRRKGKHLRHVIGPPPSRSRSRPFTRRHWARFQRCFSAREAGPGARWVVVGQRVIGQTGQGWADSIIRIVFEHEAAWTGALIVKTPATARSRPASSEARRSGRSIV